MHSTFTLIIGCLAVLFLSFACTKLTPLQSPANELDGTWVGTYKSKQIGSFPVVPTPVSATATFQVTNQSLVAFVYFTVYQQVGPPLVSPEPTQFTGTLTNHRVNMHRPAGAVCNPTRRSYTLYLDGTVRGDTLTVVGQDSICPVSGLIYQQTLTLIRQ